jgi:broad specificity phosphatase PhoE
VTRRRLLLVRHGVTDWNREGRFQGHLDPPLSEEGRLEARLLAERLTGTEGGPALIVSSSLRRALDTAEAIAAGGPGHGVRADERLREIGQGEWEGRTHAELALDDAERYDRWRRAHGREPPPGGEPHDAAARRVAAAVDELLAGDAWPACVVSHGGTLRLLAERLLGLSGGRGWALDLDNASLSVLEEADGTWLLERWNDTAHLLGRARLHVAEAEGEPLAL